LGQPRAAADKEARMADSIMGFFGDLCDSRRRHGKPTF
jgi:hypothetical protein